MEDAHNGAAGRTFEEVFLPHLDAAFNLARWLMRSDADAEDCVQEAYLRAYKAYARFRGEEGKAWLMTIVRNVCYSTLKKTRGRQEPEPFDEEIHREPVGAKTDETEQRARAETLQRGMENLPPEFREMIVLHDLEGHSYKEIAVIAGIPIGTVMSRLARGREKLRAEILAKEETYDEV